MIAAVCETAAFPIPRSALRERRDKSWRYRRIGAGVGAVDGIAAACAAVHIPAAGAILIAGSALIAAGEDQRRSRAKNHK